MAEPLSIPGLARKIGGRIAGRTDAQLTVTGTCPLDAYVSGKVSFVKNEKYAELLAGLQGGVVIAPEHLSAYCERFPQNTYILVKDVAGSMMALQEFFYADSASFRREGICATAVVDPTATIGRGAYVGANVWIGENVVVGEETKILPNSSILDNVVIGNRTFLYPGVCIYKGCEIGSDCLVHSGARIGPDGFRFEHDIPNRVVKKMYHAGRVLIGDRVEIGANTAIDRATFENSATIISDDVKIDNLVHVGHNARIGARTTIAALSCIGGSDVIGEDVWIGIGATISNGVRVGNRAKVLLNAVVAYDVPEDEMVSGFYAMPHREWKQAYRRLKGQ